MTSNVVRGMGHHREHQVRKIVEIAMKSRGEGIPYGLPKKTPQRVFFCAQTIDFTGVSEVLSLQKCVARNGLYERCKVLINSGLSFVL